MLNLAKASFEEVNELFVNIVAQTYNSAEQAADCQKLFLQKSVSRAKPKQKQLRQWMERLFVSPCLRVNDCYVTLIQPSVPRPMRTFHNPQKQSRHYANDGLSYGAIVLLTTGRYPTQEHDEASHICGHPRCVNPAHLRWEPKNINTERTICHHYGGYCQHVPRCIECSSQDQAFVAQHIAAARKSKQGK